MVCFVWLLLLRHQQWWWWQQYLLLATTTMCGPIYISLLSPACCSGISPAAEQWWCRVLDRCATPAYTPSHHQQQQPIKACFIFYILLQNVIVRIMET